MGDGQLTCSGALYAKDFVVDETWGDETRLHSLAHVARAVAEINATLLKILKEVKLKPLDSPHPHLRSTRPF